MSAIKRLLTCTTDGCTFDNNAVGHTFSYGHYLESTVLAVENQSDSYTLTLQAQFTPQTAVSDFSWGDALRLSLIAETADGNQTLYDRLPVRVLKSEPLTWEVAPATAREFLFVWAHTRTDYLGLRAFDERFFNYEWTLEVTASVASTPEPTSIPSPTPEATPESTVTPDATSSATLTPEATPAGEIAPEATPAAEIVPEATVSASPVPIVDPSVAPKPAPTPVPQVGPTPKPQTEKPAHTPSPSLVPTSPVLPPTTVVTSSGNVTAATSQSHATTGNSTTADNANSSHATVTTTTFTQLQSSPVPTIITDRAPSLTLRRSSVTPPPSNLVNSSTSATASPSSTLTPAPAVLGASTVATPAATLDFRQKTTLSLWHWLAIIVFCLVILWLCGCLGWWYWHRDRDNKPEKPTAS